MTSLKTLLVAALLGAPLSSAFAQNAPAAPPAAAPADTMTAQEREVLAAAEQLASDAAQVMEQWLITQAVTPERLFARLYFPMAKTDPMKFSTPYDQLAERDIVPLEDKTLSRSTALQYAIVTDINAYVPAHNSRFAQPLTGNAQQDYINNRTKRILGDIPSLLAARSEARYLIQRVRLETGDVLYDLSVPINVRGKHWGCARIGFRRAE